MKRTLSLIILVLLCTALVFPCGAVSTAPRFVDRAGLLSAGEADSLLYRLDDLSESQQADIVVVTIPSLNGAWAQDYADDFYDDNGYGLDSDNSGILLLVAMAEGEYYISTTGRGISALNDRAVSEIGSEVASYLSSGRYADAFIRFADLCDYYLTAEAAPPVPQSFPWQHNLVISLVTALVLALIVTVVMKGKLKSVHRATTAASYVNPGSMKLTVSRDMFLYSQVARHPRPKDNPSNRSGGTSVHVSSSGVSHGGGGGHF